MILAYLFVQVLCERTKTCTVKQTLFDLTKDNYNQVIGQSRPVFVRIENEGCPYSKPSQNYWEEASRLFPNIKFVRAECLNNGEVCKNLGAQVSPTHILFGANSTEKLETYEQNTPISLSSTPYANIIFNHLGFYPFDTPSIQEIIPESSNIFFESYKYPIFILYDSSCDEDSDFIAQFLIEATENYISSDDYGFGKIDCSQYPDECSKWGATYPSANVFSRQKAISVSITEIDRISERIDLAVNFLEQSNQVYPTPAPYVSPAAPQVPTISNVQTISVPDLQNRETSTIRNEYNTAKTPSYTGNDYTESTADVFSCTTTTLKAEAYADVLKLLNFYRKLAGLPENVKNDETLNNGCYLAAKYSSRAASLSHSIHDYWKDTCDFNSGDNWQLIASSLKNSNLAQGEERIMSMISGLIDDEGADNEDSVGHRRWFLYPYLTKIGVGFYPLSKHRMEGYTVQYPPSGVFNVINENYNSNEYTGVNFIAWPPAGPFPLERLPSSWSVYYKEFQKEGATLDNIVIKITRDDGLNLEYSKANLATNTMGMKGTLVFKLTDNSLKLIKAGRGVHVQIYFLKDSTRDCLDYTINFFDDNAEDVSCFYNTDKTKCPANIEDSKKFGNGQYSNYKPSGINRAIIHVVEDVKLTAELTIDFAPSVIIKGNKIEGKIIVGADTDLDIQDPTATDFSVNVNPSFKCGVLRTPGKCKSVKVQMSENPTIKTRGRSLIYFGSYVNIETPKKLRSGDYDYIFGIAYNGQEAYFVCTPVLYVQYACEGGNLPIYKLDNSLNCYQISASYPLSKLKTNKKYFKVYARSTDFKISSNTVADSSFSDYEIYVENSVNLEYSANLEFKAKSIKISSYSNTKIKPTFTYPYIDPYTNGLSEIQSILKIYPFSNLYISNIDSKTVLNGYSVPDILGDEAAKALLQRKETLVYDESTSDFADENGCYNYEWKSDITPLFITNGKHDQYTFTYTGTSGNNNILRLKPTEGTASKATTFIFNPKNTNGNWELIFIENYQDLTIKTAIPAEYGTAYDYFRRIRLNNVSKVKFVSLDDSEISGITTDITGSSDVDFSSNEDKSIAFDKLIVRSSATIKAPNAPCNNLNVLFASPKIVGMEIKAFNVYDYSNVKLKNCSVSGNTEFIISGSTFPSIKLLNSQFNPSSFKVVLFKYVDYGISKLLSNDDEMSPLLYGFDSEVADDLKSKIKIIKRVDDFGVTESDSTDYKVILSKDKKGIYLVVKDFDENNAPESVPEDEEDKELDDNFEVLPSPPPPPPVEVTSQPEDSSDSEPEKSDSEPEKSDSVPEKSDNVPDKSEEDQSASVVTPEPDTSEIIVEVEITSNDESALDEKLKEAFNTTNDANVVAVIKGNQFTYNSSLSSNQFIKPQENSEINFKGGNLNLVFPDKGKVTVNLPSENPDISFKGSGNVDLKLPGQENSITIESSSQINGTVTITVPTGVNSLVIDSLSLESQSSIAAKKESTTDKVNLTVRKIEAKHNSNPQLSDLTIKDTLKVAQMANVDIKNVVLTTATISYDVEDFTKWSKAGITGTFSTLPGNLFVNRVSNNSPKVDEEYSLLEGTFDGVTCSDWLGKVDFSNSGLSSKRCDDIQRLIQSENKRIVVKTEKEDKKSPLGGGAIAGIVIACVAVVAIVVVVVILVMRKKKAALSQSEDPNNNNDDDVGL
ncbi:hypothetical protein M9Y10_026095 [Tritrichomonas musculus]|uniref:SCP domain-containing protein n=1 Tax=Tritrichomonas musculus TaxID=1915356 RepID=A0ABR2H8E8_9EUKA